MYQIEAYTTLAAIFVIAIIILYLPILFFLKKKGVAIVRQLSYLGLICAAFLIIYATILSELDFINFEHHILNLTPFVWLYQSGEFSREVLPNVILFAPLGFFLPAVFQKMRRFWKTALAIFLTTFSVEFIQYFIGRSSDIDDIIENFLGGIIGYGIFKTLEYFLKNRKLWKKFTGEIPKRDIAPEKS